MKALPLILALSLFGCGDSATVEKPVAAKPIVNTPLKVPSTPDEKIAAIEKSGMPEDQKKTAIEQVKSGKL